MLPASSSGSHEVPIANVFGGAHRDLARSFPFASFNRMQASLLPSLLHSRASIVVSAPTGAGKTVIFSLAFVAMIKQLREKLSSGGRFQSGASKAVYIAPLKSIVEERMADWRRRYSPLGLKVVELTGDSASEFTGRDFMRMIDQADLLIATPEKLESVSRRFNAETKGLLSSISLLLIDEIHMLNDPRGATLEACVSRIKRLSGHPECQGMPIASLRIVAVSATLSNGGDVASWLSTSKQACQYHEFGQEYRPCPLALHVQGVRSFSKNDFLFDKNICRELPPIIFQHSGGRPSLVFCATRKKAEEAARLMHAECDDGGSSSVGRRQQQATLDFPPVGKKRAKNGHQRTAAVPVVPGGINVQSMSHARRLRELSDQLENSELRRLVLSGTAFYHAEVSVKDRALISAAYKRGDILCLCATTSLAMGVNLPAHLVVILNIKRYAAGGYQQYTKNEILQMTGRAGRKGFDTEGVAVIVCQEALASSLRNLMVPVVVESCLHNDTVTHLNSEITLENVNSIDQAVEWLKSTFFYTRVTVNPRHYNISSYAARQHGNKMKRPKIVESSSFTSSPSAADELAGFDCEDVGGSSIGSLLLTKLRADLKWLSDRGLVLWNSNATFASTALGRVACRSYISPKTAALFKSRISDDILPSSMKKILEVLTHSEEFSSYTLRKSEKKPLNEILHVTGRYTQKKKVKVKSIPDKVFQIFEHTFGNLPEFNDFNTRRDAQGVRQNTRRILRGLVKYLSEPGVACPAARVAVLLEKMIFAKMWWDNTRTATRQLPSVSTYMAESLTKNGYGSIEKIARANSMTDLARATGRKSNVTIQFGNKLVSEALKVPYGKIVKVTFDPNEAGEAAASTFPAPTCPSSPRTLYIRTHVEMRNHQSQTDELSRKYMPPACFMLIVDTEEKKGLLYFREASVGDELVTIQMKGLRCDSKTVNVRLINRRYVGVDSNCKIKVPGPHYVSQSKAGTRVLKNAPSRHVIRDKTSAGNRDLKEMLASQQSAQGILHSQSSSKSISESQKIDRAKKNTGDKKTAIAKKKKKSGNDKTLGLPRKRKRPQMLSPMIADRSESHTDHKSHIGRHQSTRSQNTASISSVIDPSSSNPKKHEKYLKGLPQESAFRYASDILFSEEPQDELFSDSDDDVASFLEEIESARRDRDARRPQSARLYNISSPSKEKKSPEKSSSITKSASEIKRRDCNALLDELEAMDEKENNEILNSISACEKGSSVAQPKKANINQECDGYIESLFQDEYDSFYAEDDDEIGHLKFMSKIDGGAHTQSSAHMDSQVVSSQVDSEGGSLQKHQKSGLAASCGNQIDILEETDNAFAAWKYRGPIDARRREGPSPEQIEEAEAAELALSNRPSPSAKSRQKVKSKRPKRKTTKKRMAKNVGRSSSDTKVSKSYSNYARGRQVESHSSSQTSSRISNSQQSRSLSQSSDFQSLSGASHAQSHSQQHRRQQAAQRHYDQKMFGHAPSSSHDVPNSTLMGMISESYKKALGSELKSRPKLRSRAPISCSGSIASLTPSPTPSPPQPSQETQSVHQGGSFGNRLFMQTKNEPECERQSESIRHSSIQDHQQMHNYAAHPLPQEECFIPMATVVSVQSSQGTWIPMDNAMRRGNISESPLPKSYATIAPKFGSSSQLNDSYQSRNQYHSTGALHRRMPSHNSNDQRHPQQYSKNIPHQPMLKAPYLSSDVASAAHLINSYSKSSNNSSAYPSSSSFNLNAGVRQVHNQHGNGMPRSEANRHLKSSDVFR